MIRRPPGSTRFPSSTLVRSLRKAISDVLDIIEDIDNLIQRAEPQEMIDEEYIDALGILKDITFKAK